MSEEMDKKLGLLEAHTPPKYQQESGEQEPGESVEARAQDEVGRLVDDGRARKDGESAGGKVAGKQGGAGKGKEGAGGSGAVGRVD